MHEQVKAAERLASEEEAKLRSTENEFTALSNVVDELRTECESWKAETQRVQQQLKVRKNITMNLNDCWSSKVIEIFFCETSVNPLLFITGQH